MQLTIDISKGDLYMINKLLEEIEENNNKIIEEIEQIKEILFNKEVNDILLGLNDDNIEECINSIANVYVKYNIDEVDEDELEDYATYIALELVGNELRCNCVDKWLFG